MPGTAFKGRSPEKTPEKTKAVSSAAEKKIFAKEMHFQVYRIENVLKIKSSETLKGLASTNPDLLKQPALMRFFDAFQGKKTNEFIEKAKMKSQAEREKLLDGIRRLIFKAKKAKVEYTKKRTEVEKKAETEQQKEIAKMQEMLKRKLTNEDVVNIETNLATPLNVNKKKLDLNKVQYYYTSIIVGQKAFGTRMQDMQKNYGDAMNKFQAFNKKYTSGWRKYAGVVDWGWRRVKTVGGWLKRGWNFVRGKKSKPSKKPSEKVNEAIQHAKEYFGKNIDRLKLVKKRIDARSQELKKGIGTYKGDIREKLKHLISREDWTKAQQLKEEQLKALLEQQKKTLGAGLQRVQEKGKEIDGARGRTSNLSVSLRNKYKLIQTGETSLDKRLKAVRGRLSKLEKIYGKKDPRVVFLRKKVLVPLLKGQDRMAQVKEGTAQKLNNVELSNQKLDLLKADTALSETSAVGQIDKLELQIKFQSEKLKTLGNKRLELQQLLEGMETAYMAVDEFKNSVDKNLDKMLKDNNKAVEAVDKQYDILKKVKANEPGIGTSLYNTVGIGHYGVYGAVIELPFKYFPRAVGYLGVNALNKLGILDNGVDWKETEKWHIGGMIEYVYKKYDAWLSKGAFKKWAKGEGWFLESLASMGNFSAGVVGSALGLIHGGATLVLETPKVLDSLEMMTSDWKELKRALLGVIHYNDLEKGNYEVWGGRIAGDVIVIFLTAGGSAGASAAAAAGRAGASWAGRAAAYAGAFLKEVGTKAFTTGAGAVRFVGRTLRHPLIALKGAAGAFAGMAAKQYHLFKGLIRGRGLKDYYAHVASKMGDKLDDLARTSDDFVKAFDPSLIKNPKFRKIFDDIKNKGIDSVPIKNLDDFVLGLKKEMYRYSRSGKHVPGIKGRIKLEVLAKKVGRFNALKVKGAAIQELLLTRYLDKMKIKTNQLLKMQPASATGAQRLKNAIREKLNQLYDSVDNFTEKMAATGSKGLKAKYTRKIAGGERRIKLLKDKLKDVSVWEFVGKKPGQYVAAAGKKLAKLHPRGLRAVPGKLKAVVDKVKADPLILWNNPVVAIGAWPVWVPTMYIRRILAGKAGEAARLASAKSALKSKGVMFGPKRFSEMANVRAISDMSSKINSLLKQGQLKEAVKLYYASRVVAKKYGVPLGQMDKSFLGFVHKVAPASVNYMGRVSDLMNPLKVDQLPNDAAIDKQKLSSYEGKAAKALENLIKVKHLTKTNKK